MAIVNPMKPKKIRLLSCASYIAIGVICVLSIIFHISNAEDSSNDLSPKIMEMNSYLQQLNSKWPGSHPVPAVKPYEELLLLKEDGRSSMNLGKEEAKIKSEDPRIESTNMAKTPQHELHAAHKSQDAMSSDSGSSGSGTIAFSNISEVASAKSKSLMDKGAEAVDNTKVKMAEPLREIDGAAPYTPIVTNDSVSNDRPNSASKASHSAQMTAQPAQSGLVMADSPLPHSDKAEELRASTFEMSKESYPQSAESRNVDEYRGHQFQGSEYNINANGQRQPDQLPPDAYSNANQPHSDAYSGPPNMGSYRGPVPYDGHTNHGDQRQHSQYAAQPYQGSRLSSSHEYDGYPIHAHQHERAAYASLSNSNPYINQPHQGQRGPDHLYQESYLKGESPASPYINRQPPDQQHESQQMSRGVQSTTRGGYVGGASLPYQVGQLPAHNYAHSRPLQPEQHAGTLENVPIMPNWMPMEGGGALPDNGQFEQSPHDSKFAQDVRVIDAVMQRRGPINTVTAPNVPGSNGPVRSSKQVYPSQSTSVSLGQSAQDLYQRPTQLPDAMSEETVHFQSTSVSLGQGLQKQHERPTPLLNITSLQKSESSSLPSASLGREPEALETRKSKLMSQRVLNASFSLEQMKAAQTAVMDGLTIAFVYGYKGGHYIRRFSRKYRAFIPGANWFEHLLQKEQLSTSEQALLTFIICSCLSLIRYVISGVLFWLASPFRQAKTLQLEMNTSASVQALKDLVAKESKRNAQFQELMIKHLGLEGTSRSGSTAGLADNQSTAEVRALLDELRPMVMNLHGTTEASPSPFESYLSKNVEMLSASMNFLGCQVVDFIQRQDRAAGYIDDAGSDISGRERDLHLRRIPSGINVPTFIAAVAAPSGTPTPKMSAFSAPVMTDKVIEPTISASEAQEGQLSFHGGPLIDNVKSDLEKTSTRATLTAPPQVAAGDLRWDEQHAVDSAFGLDQRPRENATTNQSNRPSPHQRPKELPSQSIETDLTMILPTKKPNPNNLFEATADYKSSSSNATDKADARCALHTVGPPPPISKFGFQVDASKSEVWPRHLQNKHSSQQKSTSMPSPLPNYLGYQVDVGQTQSDPPIESQHTSQHNLPLLPAPLPGQLEWQVEPGQNQADTGHPSTHSQLASQQNLPLVPTSLPSNSRHQEDAGLSQSDIGHPPMQNQHASHQKLASTSLPSPGQLKYQADLSQSQSDVRHPPMQSQHASQQNLPIKPSPLPGQFGIQVDAVQNHSVIGHAPMQSQQGSQQQLSSVSPPIPGKNEYRADLGQKMPDIAMQRQHQKSNMGGPPPLPGQYAYQMDAVQKKAVMGPPPLPGQHTYQLDAGQIKANARSPPLPSHQGISRETGQRPPITRPPPLSVQPGLQKDTAPPQQGRRPPPMMKHHIPHMLSSGGPPPGALQQNRGSAPGNPVTPFPPRNCQHNPILDGDAKGQLSQPPSLTALQLP